MYQILAKASKFWESIGHDIQENICANNCCGGRTGDDSDRPELRSSTGRKDLSPGRESDPLDDDNESSILKRKAKAWTAEEDRLLKLAVERFNGKNWKEIAKCVPHRTSSQCSQRWRRLKPHKIRQPWTAEEDKMLLDLVSMYGLNWGWETSQTIDISTDTSN